MKKFLGKSWLKMIDINRVMNSRIFLYVLFILSIGQLFVYASSGDYMFCTLFVLVGFLTTFFSKNMIAVMTVALVVSNVLKQGTKVRDGFEGKEKNGDHIENEDDDAGSSDVKQSPPPTKTSTPSPTVSSENNKMETKKPTPAVTKNLQDTSMNFQKMADIQLKMLQNLSELKPVLEQSKDLLSKIKESVPSSTSTPTKNTAE